MGGEDLTGAREEPTGSSVLGETLVSFWGWGWRIVELGLVEGSTDGGVGAVRCKLCDVISLAACFDRCS